MKRSAMPYFFTAMNLLSQFTFEQHLLSLSSLVLLPLVNYDWGKHERALYKLCLYYMLSSTCELDMKDPVQSIDLYFERVIHRRLSLAQVFFIWIAHSSMDADCPYSHVEL